MAKVMVFGGTGFVGSHAARACVRQGHEVLVGTVAGPGPSLLGDIKDQVEFVPGDLCHWPDLISSLHNESPDVVVNCAGFASGDAGLMNSAMTSPSRAIDVNILGFANLLQAVVEFGIPRLVWTSSASVFGTADIYEDGTADDDAPYFPGSIYGGTKAFCEVLARQYRQQHGLDVVGLRLPFVYGPDRWYGGQWTAIRDLFEAASNGRGGTIQCPETPMDLIYAIDAGRAIERYVSTAKVPRDSYNLVGHRASIADLADAVLSARPDVAIKVEIIDPPRVLPRMNDHNVRSDLNFAPEFDLVSAVRHYLHALAEGE